MHRGLLRLTLVGRLALVLFSILCISTVARSQNTLEKTKDVVIDQPADKIEDAFDNDDDYNGSCQTNSCARQKTSHHDDDESTCGACAVEKAEPTCGEVKREKPVENMCEAAACEPRAALGTADDPIPITVNELRDNPEAYCGKYVSIDAKMHDTFTNTVFSVEEGTHELLILGAAKCSAAIPINGGELEKGDKVRVVGLVTPYDFERLDSTYGPLNLGHHDDNSFTHSPVLVVQPPQAAAIEPPPLPEPEVRLKPEPAPEPAPVIEEEVFIAPPPAPPAPEPILPKTAGDLPFAGLVGMISLLGASGLRLYRR